MTVHSHAVEKYVTGRRLATSAARWPHLVAERWSHGAGELPCAYINCHPGTGLMHGL